MGSTHPLEHAETFALIAVGGFLGSNLRFLIGQFSPGLGGTLVVNALGSAVLGFLAYEALKTDLLSAPSRTVLSTGVLSSFTTYSTFAMETVQAAPVLGLVNLFASYGLGFAGVLLGRHLAHSMEGSK
ncbi:MAG: fluoride efflux transporter FluC [Halobacteriota archaeon]